MAITGVSVAGVPVDSAFTYRSQLKQAGQPYSGNVDLKFRLFDAAVVGTQIGGTMILSGVPVANGLFTIELSASGEFGSQTFNGDARWLEITFRRSVNGAPAPDGPVQEEGYAGSSGLSGMGGMTILIGRWPGVHREAIDLHRLRSRCLKPQSSGHVWK